MRDVGVTCVTAWQVVSRKMSAKMYPLFVTNPGMPPPGGCLTDPPYAHMSHPKMWSRLGDSNSRPTHYECVRTVRRIKDWF